MRLSPQDQRVFDILNTAAESGAECPSNLAFCSWLNLGSVSRPAEILAKLEKAGLIKVERFSRSRIVTIIATGKRTAGEQKARKHWRVSGAVNPGAYTYNSPRRKAGIHVTDPRPDMETATFVHRDPCPFCGVRADIGCAHKGRLSMGAF